MRAGGVGGGRREVGGERGELGSRWRWLEVGGGRWEVGGLDGRQKGSDLRQGSHKVGPSQGDICTDRRLINRL